jgi:hypothetical protein
MPPNNKQEGVFVSITLSPESCLNEDKDLKQNKISVSPTALPETGPSPEAGLKSPELVILVSAVAVPLVASGIARIIDALGRNRRPIGKAKSWKPVLATDGTLILDFHGQARHGLGGDTYAA